MHHILRPLCWFLTNPLLGLLAYGIAVLMWFQGALPPLLVIFWAACIMTIGRAASAWRRHDRQTLRPYKPKKIARKAKPVAEPPRPLASLAIKTQGTAKADYAALVDRLPSDLNRFIGDSLNQIGDRR